MQAEWTRRGLASLLALTAGCVAARTVHADSQPQILSEDIQEIPLTVHVLRPLLELVEERRKIRSEEDADYSNRIDHELNRDRVNFLLYSWGETHEPPEIEWAIIASQTFLTIDLSTNTAGLVSWTHDIRAPEVERYLRSQDDFDGIPKRIDQAYYYGGKELMRRVVEDATGLSVDTTAIFPDTILASLVNRITGPIRVNIPKDFWAHPVYIGGRKYPARPFKQGMATLAGEECLQLIKSVPINDTAPVLEHNRRKHAVIEGIRRELRRIDVPLKIAQFMKTQLDAGNLTLDFDLTPLLLNLEDPRLLAQIMGSMFSKDASSFFPSIEKTIYIVDPAHGDGGVQWARANAAVNFITREDVEFGMYPKQHGWEIPHMKEFIANPYSPDLVNDYWLPMRKRIKDLLLA